ncbi:DUF4169 family protein [Sphingobium sp. BS19]|uniref:DUF4169 family protein n=1 Tax=Sphingobium sp. BS19 TaxID=3018973 RepID=UPI0022EDE439|nr:DUF4169 family protein [Sphingobium sp. BS19]GLI98122.1 DUF4169 domain-containing protein [Sphingobium sp. BS19]
MAEIVNLRLARKARKRADAEQMAAENRARSGRTKAEKRTTDDAAHRLAQAVDGAKRET